MYHMNALRLVNSCCVRIEPPEVADALVEWICDNDIDLNRLNVDNLYVNGISYLPPDEESDLPILHEDGEDRWTINDEWVE